MTSRNREPRPSDAAWSETERELLAAAREERMPAALEARMREALGLPLAASEVVPRASLDNTASARQLFAGKLPLWGMLSIVAIGAISYYTLGRTTSQPANEAAHAESPPVLPPTAAALASRAQRPSEASAGSTVSAENLGAAHSGSADQLRLEAELLESARTALGKGDLSDARRWLTRYNETFAEGVLHPESEVLAIELKVRAGARTAAKTQADHFLTKHPAHPLRDKVRELTTRR